jgi:hypothetical protein
MLFKVIKEEFHERYIEHAMALQRGRERLTRQESPGKPGP